MEFEWDDANMKHIAVHNVTKEEAESALNGFTVDIEYQDWDHEERFVEVAITARGRCLVIVTTWRGTRVRVVTAFDATEDLNREYSLRRWNL